MTTKRRCVACHRTPGTKELAGVIVFVLHTPPGGGYCVGSDQPVPLRRGEATQ